MEEIKNYESMSLQDRWNMLATVANLYYNAEMTQNEIADRMYTSRSKISRMLKEARQLGIVTITINEPWERELDLESRIQQAFHVNTIRVVATRDIDKSQLSGRISEVAAYYLDSIIKEQMVIGISWGNTLYHIVRYIDANNKKNIPITVVPIMGAANIRRPERDAIDLAKSLAGAYGGTYQYIYAPLFVKNKTIRDSLVQDDSIANALELGRKADVILTSCGSVEYKSWEQHLTESTFDQLMMRGAVGHIGGHFYDCDGKEIRTGFIDRMVGLTFDEMKACPNLVCIAYGGLKGKAIAGALRGGLIDTLIMDTDCAQAVLAEA